MEIRSIRGRREWRRLKQLYLSAFPAYERKPLWLIRLMQWCRKTDVWVILHENEFAGIAMTMNGEDLVLLDYFAVEESLRGSGIGAQALAALQIHYRGRRFFLEIESPAVPCENREERIRRKRFYLRNGMTELGVMVDLFGTTMELLGHDCTLTYAEYRDLYVQNLGHWAGKHMKELPYPENDESQDNV